MINLEENILEIFISKNFIRTFEDFKKILFTQYKISMDENQENINKGIHRLSIIKNYLNTEEFSKIVTNNSIFLNIKYLNL